MMPTHARYGNSPEAGYVLASGFMAQGSSSRGVKVEITLNR
jgi:hypothetical protein